MSLQHVPSLPTIGNIIILRDNNKKYTSIKIYICTYKLLIMRHVSIFLDYTPRVLHQTGVYKIQKNYPIDYNVCSLQTLDIIKSVVDVQIGLCNVNIIGLENYKCSEK
jgi:hypothetical protein